MANTDIKLKPCPFCGSAATNINLSASCFIVCSNLQCEASSGMRGTLAAAIAAWNNRAADLKDWASDLGDVYNEVSLYSGSDEILDMLDKVLGKINKAAGYKLV